MTWLHAEHLSWENKEENGIVANPAGCKGTRREILNFLSSMGLYLYIKALKKEFLALHQESSESRNSCPQCVATM